MITPTDLLHLAQTGLVPRDVVTLDTETSGLYADDGARVSTVSLAWADPDEEWREFVQPNDVGATWGDFEYAPGEFVPVVSFAWPFDQGVAGTGKPEDTGQETLFPDAENLTFPEWHALLRWLGSRDLVMHNAKFDVEKMRVGVRRWPGVGSDLLTCVAWDTQIANNLVYPLTPGGLKPSSARLFGADTEDESKKVKAYLRAAKLPAGRWDLMPWDVVGPYADQDARLTLGLYLRQQHDIWEIQVADWLGTPAQVVAAYLRRHRIMKILTDMERRGLPYNEVESRLAADECRSRAEVVARRLPFKPTPADAKKFFFGEGHTSKGAECLGLVPYAQTPTGEPSLTEEVVTRMVADDVYFAKEWAEYRKVTNAASMWYDGYADAMGADGRLRTAFRQNGTRSARFSVERVNLQAIPQDYRLEGFEAMAGIPTPRTLIGQAVPDGWRLWELDLAQAELRVAAMWAGCKRMVDMITNQEDLHTFTTQSLFGVGPDDPRFKQYRQIGKRANFTLLFGSGANTFRAMVAKETGVQYSEFEAGRLVAGWNALYPEFKRAINKAMDRVADRQSRYGHGWVDMLNGERRWFEQYEDAHKAFNQRVQGNLAQFGMDWMIRSDYYLHGCGVDQQAIEEGYAGAGLVLTIHDSQVLLLPDTAEGKRMALTCAELGRDLWTSTFPDIPGDVDAKVWG